MDKVYSMGTEIARVLGHGVRFAGPYIDKTGNVFALEFFDEETGGFTARDLAQAKEKFAKTRAAFKKPVPVFA